MLVTLVSLVGCEDEMPDYYDSKSYDLEDFNAVELGDALQIEIIQADQFSVVASGETEDLEDLELRVENGVLKGKYRQGSNSHKRTKVVISMPQLRGAVLEAATDTKITGFSEPEDTFFLRLSGASAAVVEGNYEVLEARIEGASELNLKGEGDVLDAVIGGASRLNAGGFAVNVTSIDVGGASEATISVHDLLEGSVQGSSRLRYQGNPEVIDVFVANDSRMSRLEL